MAAEKAIGGIIAAAVVILAAIFLAPIGLQFMKSLPSGTTAPSPTGSWQVCLTNANYATLGLGTCPTSLVAAKAVTKSQTSPTSNFVVYFNVSVLPPGGSNQMSYNAIVGVGPVPSITNTSNPTETAPVFALTTGGLYAVTITPSGGSAAYQQQIVPFTPGTGKTVAFQAKFSPIIGEMALAQYPLGIQTTFTITDQSSGAVYGTVSLSTTFT